MKVCKIWFALPLAEKNAIESSKASKPLRGLNGEDKTRANVFKKYWKKKPQFLFQEMYLEVEKHLCTWMQLSSVH